MKTAEVTINYVDGGYGENSFNNRITGTVEVEDNDTENDVLQSIFNYSQDVDDTFLFLDGIAIKRSTIVTVRVHKFS